MAIKSNFKKHSCLVKFDDLLTFSLSMRRKTDIISWKLFILNIDIMMLYIDITRPYIVTMILHRYRHYDDNTTTVLYVTYYQAEAEMYLSQVQTIHTSYPLCTDALQLFACTVLAPQCIHWLPQPMLPCRECKYYRISVGAAKLISLLVPHVC